LGRLPEIAFPLVCSGDLSILSKGNLTNARFYISLLIAIGIGGHLSPSLSDIKGALEVDPNGWTVPGLI
jgi:hypothetical protein